MHFRRTAGIALLWMLLSPVSGPTASAAGPPRDIFGMRSPAANSVHPQRRHGNRFRGRRPFFRRSSSQALTPRTRLPRGRNYYQGRYFGNYNNRFYGPQYGYF